MTQTTNELVEGEEMEEYESELQDEYDALRTCFEEFERTFAGVTTTRGEIEVDLPFVKPTSFKLVWSRYNKVMRLLVLKGDGTVDQPLVNMSLQHRLVAATALPKLIAAVFKETDKTVQAIRAARVLIAAEIAKLEKEKPR